MWSAAYGLAGPRVWLGDPPVHFALTAARSSGSATYCSMYPHDMQMWRSGSMFFQNEIANLFIGPRRPVLGGPTRRSVDWHFGHCPDFMSHILDLRFESVCPKFRFSGGYRSFIRSSSAHSRRSDTASTQAARRSPQLQQARSSQDRPLRMTDSGRTRTAQRRPSSFRLEP